MGEVISLDEFRKKKLVTEQNKRKFIDEFINYLEFTMEFESDIEFEDWFDNLDTITYNTINTSINLDDDDEKTEDPS